MSTAEEKLQQIGILIKNFNNYSGVLATFISNISPSQSIPFKMYKSEMDKLIREGSNIMIDTFVLNALKYEEQIMNGDDNFFLGNNYDDITKKDNNMIMQVFEFKKIWKIINDDNKNLIKQYMQLLCQISRTYFNLVVELKQMKSRLY